MIHRLRPETHIVRLAGLQLPGPALQDPDIVAPVVNAPRLGGIVESAFDPVRVGDTFGGERKTRQLAIPKRRAATSARQRHHGSSTEDQSIENPRTY
jgi:hypothetical protein